MRPREVLGDLTGQRQPFDFGSVLPELAYLSCLSGFQNGLVRGPCFERSINALDVLCLDLQRWMQRLAWRRCRLDIHLHQLELKCASWWLLTGALLSLILLEATNLLFDWREISSPSPFSLLALRRLLHSVGYFA